MIFLKNPLPKPHFSGCWLWCVSIKDLGEPSDAPPARFTAVASTYLRPIPSALPSSRSIMD